MNKEITQKVAELEEKHNRKIIPISIKYKNEYIIGYAFQPNRYERSLAISYIAKSQYTAGLLLMESCLIRSESDQRLYIEDSKYDAVVFKAGKILLEDALSNKNGENLYKKYKTAVANSGEEQAAALIKYHLHIDPDKLSDEEFYKEWARLEWVMIKEGLKKT